MSEPRRRDECYGISMQSHIHVPPFVDTSLKNIHYCALFHVNQLIVLTLFMRNHLLVFGFKFLLLFLKYKIVLTLGIWNSMLLCPEQSQTSPNRTSLRVSVAPDAVTLMLCGPPGGRVLTLFMRNHLLVFGFKFLLLFLKYKIVLTLGIWNSMLLCPEQSQTSPNRTSLRVSVAPDAVTLMLYGPPGGRAANITDHTALPSFTPDIINFHMCQCNYLWQLFVRGWFEMKKKINALMDFTIVGKVKILYLLPFTPPLSQL